MANTDIVITSLKTDKLGIFKAFHIVKDAGNSAKKTKASDENSLVNVFLKILLEVSGHLRTEAYLPTSEVQNVECEGQRNQCFLHLY